MTAEVSLDDLNRIGSKMTSNARHCLMMWAFMYVLIEETQAEVDRGDRTQVLAVAHIRSQCVEQAMRLLGTPYSARWSLEVKQRVTGQITAILRALVELSTDKDLLYFRRDDNDGDAYSPVGCGRKTYGGVYLENSGITI